MKPGWQSGFGPVIPDRGYVTNISETCDPDNDVQLITSVHTAGNNTDDSELLAQSLAEQSDGGHDIEKMTDDGGYTGPTTEEACETHRVELHPSRLRGGKSTGEQWGWEVYQWQMSDEGVPERVTCPQGQEIDWGQAAPRIAGWGAAIGMSVLTAPFSNKNVGLSRVNGAGQPWRSPPAPCKWPFCDNGSPQKTMGFGPGWRPPCVRSKPPLPPASYGNISHEAIAEAIR